MRRTPGTKPGAKPRTVDEYLAALSPEKRRALEKLRKAIRAAAPGVEECISYGIPGFRLDGRLLVWMGAGANHCSFYPGGVVQDFPEIVEAYDTSKGTIRFPPGEPLPAALVRRLVKARIAKNAPGGRRSKSR